jgi:hypothetical protein
MPNLNAVRNERVILNLLDLSEEVHKAARYIDALTMEEATDTFRDAFKPKIAETHARIRELGQQLLDLAGKPALHVAYFLPCSITTNEATIIARHWKELGLTITGETDLLGHYNPSPPPDGLRTDDLQSIRSFAKGLT